MRHLKTTLAVLGAVTVLVLAGNTISMAATGKAFILGKGNTASTATALKRTTNGPAMKIVTRRAADVPFAVNGKGKVPNLNVDRLDGKDSTAFASAASVAALNARQPIARGFVSTGAGGTNPSLATGSTGVSGVSWDAGDTRYVLTVTGETYLYNKYVTVITPVCPNLPPSTSSVGGDLLVEFGAGSACTIGGFAYVIYKLV